MFGNATLDRLAQPVAAVVLLGLIEFLQEYLSNVPPGRALAGGGLVAAKTAVVLLGVGMGAVSAQKIRRPLVAGLRRLGTRQPRS